MNMLLLHTTVSVPRKPVDITLFSFLSPSETCFKNWKISPIYIRQLIVYILYKHQFFGNILEESGLVFTQLDRAVQHNYENKFVEKLPIVSKKRLSRKKFRRHLLPAEQRNVSTQTMGSAFLVRIQSIKNSKYESELIKIVDCLLDGHGLIDNSLLYLEIRNK